jgi:hypothetical protein
MYPTNDSAAMRMVSSQISCGLTGKRAELAVGHERQQDHRHCGEDQAGAQLLPRQALQPFVQCGFEHEQQSRRDACGGGRRLIAHHRERAEGEREHGCDHGRRAEDLVVHHFAVAKECDGGREGGECKGERDHASLAGIQCERPPDAAEQPGKCERAQARGPLPLGLSALLPAALDSDHEADGERDRQSPDELECVHVLPAPGL